MAGRRFKASFDTTVAHLCATLVRMGARARVDFGRPIFKYERRLLADSGIACDDSGAAVVGETARITFWREDRGYAFQCDAWRDYRDNLRATQLAISNQYRSFEEYVVTRPGVVGGFDALFGGFLLLGDGRREWHTVLGVGRDATREEVDRAYRRLAKTLHPDIGGDEGAWKTMLAAYREARAAIDERG